MVSLLACSEAPETPRISQAALDRAHLFLKTQERGQDILEYVHLGATYDSHEYLKTLDLGGGSFALVYRFNWQPDGITDIAFLCDERGTLESVRIEASNGEFNSPFALANLTIGIVGNVLLETLAGDLNNDDKRQIQRIIRNADAKSLLEWSLRFQQSKLRSAGDAR
jgi:hypothetical protein